ncbi:hypothetical protein MJO28_007104 [Puccinia striiformis f. sp. tritici]|uniref:Anaphase-promoting complex subunit 5 n=2 Tax=Puccinia striiformis f. sp. tritici TaxID=168172 RepID=A0A0L0VRZ4_9BASI|nr:hypothetical protein Pst134EB_014213 [Puccinia striiformis f. sp. tritici]KAI7951420.1 hypothetical protein MJO28_007104 [Puccinia striiformis f. sp. tritici]KAI7955660.1 hypothetical protein MJO29_007059 [Puccinia striiformis f. sp. tritici]KAI9630669.1 hypothetical protein KEM48_013696 [Puccinia striiformis f. sp. tritici PST-130]KNF01967.1 hypothetical protein PSTG_04791 [Puccinia striiformis f. sp. tritici PST-78]
MTSQALLTVRPIDLTILTLLTILSELQKTNKNQPEQELLLIISTELIFENQQLESIAEFYQFIRARSKHIERLRLHQLLSSINQSINLTLSVDGLYRFFNRVQNLTSPVCSDVEPEIQPDSPIGLYARRCRLYVSQLEFDPLSDLANQMKSFCSNRRAHLDHFHSRSGPSVATPSPGHSLPHSHRDNQSPFPPFDSSRDTGGNDVDPILQAYLDFTDTYAPDYNKSINGLRKFYDIRSSVSASLSKDTGAKMSHLSGSNHQQALLSLARFHFAFEAYPTAMDALEEATRLARLAGDRTIIDQCTCLRRRIVYFSGLESEDGGVQRDKIPLTGPIQAQAGLQALRNLGSCDQKGGSRGNNCASTSAGPIPNEWRCWDSNEEIFSVFKSLSKAEPMNHLHGRLFRASRMRISNAQDLAQGSVPTCSSFDRISWYAIQARIWDLQGQSELCEIYEDLALDVEENESDKAQFWIEDRIKLISKSDVHCHRALRLARNGNFYQALLGLCDLIIDNGSDFHSFRFIHQTIFQIFGLKAKHDGDEHALASLKMLHQTHHHPSIFFPPNLGMDSSPSVHKQINDLYGQAERLMKSGNHHAALCPIVSAISHADKMNLKLEQAKGIIMWSEVLLHLQQEPTSTTSQSLQTENDGDGSQEPVTTSWIFNKIKDHNLFDLPGLRSDPILAADLLLVVVRCKILNMFSTDSYRHPDRVYEILDLFGWIDKLYRKTENVEGRKRVIGYQLIVIEEIQMIQDRDKSTGQEKDEVEGNFEEVLTQVKQKLKNEWKELCSDDRDQQQPKHDDKKKKKNTKEGADGDDCANDDGIGSLDSLLAKVNVLFTRASANRFL